MLSAPNSIPLLSLALASLVSPSLQAVEQDAVIVTANRSAQTVDETLASVTVISREDIDNSQARDVLDLLRLQAGIDVTRNGGPGATSSVLLRGTNSSHTLVLIDGVRASSATVGSFAWQNLDPEIIQRIEIVRGPRAAQYGSDAVGGVIQIFTRRNSAPFVRAEAGSFNTRTVAAGIGGGEVNKYSLTVEGGEADGFSATRPKNTTYYDPDDDGFRNRSLSGRLDTALSESTRARFSAWYSESDSEYDAFGGGIGSNDTTNYTLNAEIRNQTRNWWQQSFKLGLAQDDLITTSSAVYQIKTDRVMADWQHDFTLSQSRLLTLGLSTYTDQAVNRTLSSNTTTFDESVRNDAIFAILQGASGKQDYTLSLRNDDHESYGSHATGQLAWGYESSPGNRMFISWGNAFRAPTFNELFFPFYGNPNLKPETSETVEIGLRQRIARHQQFRLSAFHTTIDDLIAYDPTIFLANNVDQARIDGLELEYQLERKPWRLTGSLTLQKAIDESDRSDLDRRPRRKLAMQINRKLLAQGHLGLEWIYASARKDGNNTLPAYNLVNLSARYPLRNSFWLEGRVENLFDEDYELAWGYNTAGLSAYLGISYRPGE